MHYYRNTTEKLPQNYRKTTEKLPHRSETVGTESATKEKIADYVKRAKNIPYRVIRNGEPPSPPKAEHGFYRSAQRPRSRHGVEAESRKKQQEKQPKNQDEKYTVKGILHGEPPSKRLIKGYTDYDLNVVIKEGSGLFKK